MKRLIATLLLLCAASIFAPTLAPNGRKSFKPSSLVSGCSTLQDSFTTTSAAINFFVGKNSDGFSLGNKITYAGTTADICSLNMPIYKVGTPNKNVVAYIYNDDGSAMPGTLNGTASDAVLTSSLSTSEPTEYVAFSFNGTKPRLTNGAVYHLVLYISTFDGANNVACPHVVVTYGTGRITKGTNVPPDQITDNSAKLKFKLYSN